MVKKGRILKDLLKEFPNAPRAKGMNSAEDFVLSMVHIYGPKKTIDALNEAVAEHIKGEHHGS